MKSTTINIISILIAILIIVGSVYLSNKNNSDKKIDNSNEQINNVFMENGKQIIEIKAKGGYSPKKTLAKANIPTVVRFKTEATFDCSSSVLFPPLNISQMLPPNGIADIEIGNPKSGKLGVTCGMGMYSFWIDFQDVLTKDIWRINR